MFIPIKYDYIIILVRGVPFVIDQSAEPSINRQINSRWVTQPISASVGPPNLDDIQNVKNDFDDFNISFSLHYDFANVSPDKDLYALNIARTIGFSALKNLIRANAYFEMSKYLNICSVVSKQVVEPVCLLRSLSEQQSSKGVSRVSLNFIPVTLLKTPTGSTQETQTAAKAGKQTSATFGGK